MNKNKLLDDFKKTHHKILILEKEIEELKKKMNLITKELLFFLQKKIFYCLMKEKE